MNNLNIVADENIPQVETLFGKLGRVTRVNGRNLHRQQLTDCDVLLVRSVTRVDQHLLQGTPVRFVATATIGVDHLDINYLENAGIGWASAPGSNAGSVVDYIISALCRLDGVLEGLLNGGSVGIIGMGNVGSSLYQRLSAVGVRCVGYDPLIEQNRYPILIDIEAVCACDVICLHAPLTKRGEHPSYHMFNQSRLDQLKPGAVLINAGRGAVIDNQALKQLLRQREDICVVLDVWENEPDIDLELLQRIDLATPHIAGYSLDGKLAGTRMIFDACCKFEGIKVDSDGGKPAPLTIALEEESSLSETLSEAVLKSYDIASDDQRCRGALIHADNNDIGTGFDLLRKNYPVRREFSSYQIQKLNYFNPQTIHFLRALGFECSD